jgi:hypothetical protein
MMGMPYMPSPSLIVLLDNGLMCQANNNAFVHF